jgi:hypothetical protein
MRALRVMQVIAGIFLANSDSKKEQYKNRI